MKEKKLVFGVGINDADYDVSKSALIDGKWKKVWNCPFHIKWFEMIRRCYSLTYKSTHPTYSSCLTVPEWHYFMTFRAWMEKQDWQDKQLDKDILLPGNKVYGPEFCVFVDRSVNNFLLQRESDRGEWPIGVNLHKKTGKFAAQANDLLTKDRKYLGLFNTPEEAHAKWLTFKLEQAKILASQQLDPRVAAALIDRYENYAKYFGENK